MLKEFFGNGEDQLYRKVDVVRDDEDDQVQAFKKDLKFGKAAQISTEKAFIDLFAELRHVIENSSSPSQQTLDASQTSSQDSLKDLMYVEEKSYQYLSARRLALSGFIIGSLSVSLIVAICLKQWFIILPMFCALAAEAFFLKLKLSV